MRTVRKCDFDFLMEWFYPVFGKTILTGQYVDRLIWRHILTHISLHHVTLFEPITAAHFDQRYNKKNINDHYRYSGNVFKRFFEVIFSDCPCIQIMYIFTGHQHSLLRWCSVLAMAEVSVHLSVTPCDPVKTTKARIMKSPPPALQKTLVSGSVKLPRNSRGVTPIDGAKWERVGKICDFHPISHIISVSE